MGLNSNRAPEAQCSWTGTLQAQTAEAQCSRTGTVQAQTTNAALNGLTPSAFDPSLEHSTDGSGAVLEAPALFFAVVSFVVFRRRRIIFLPGEV